MTDPHSKNFESLRRDLASRYQLAHESVFVGQRRFDLTRVDDTNALVDAIDPATFAVDERLPYWAEIWASSIALAEWVTEMDPANGHQVLELGCGLGLPGIAAAAMGATVTLTDYEDDALLFSRCNALENLETKTVDATMRFVNLDWRKPNLDRQYSLVLGADIVYERKNFSALLSVVRAALKHDGIAVFSEPDRTVGGDFFTFAAQSGFRLERSTRLAAQQDRKVSVHIVTMTRTQQG